MTEVRIGDVERLPLVAKEAESLGLDDNYDPLSFARSVSRIVSSGGSYWTLEDGSVKGLCVGIIVPTIWNHTEKTAKCLVFKIDDKFKNAHTKKLMDAFESWAKDNGANMVAYEMPTKRKGFEKVGVHIARAI